MKKWFIVLLLLIGCGGNDNEWSSEMQERFKTNCKKMSSKGRYTDEYCYCIMNKLMQKHTEENFKLESIKILEGNSNDEFTAKLVDIVTGCE